MTPGESAHRGEQLGSRSEVEGFRVQIGQGLLGGEHHVVGPLLELGFFHEGEKRAVVEAAPGIEDLSISGDVPSRVREIGLDGSFGVTAGHQAGSSVMGRSVARTGSRGRHSFVSQLVTVGCRGVSQLLMTAGIGPSAVELRGAADPMIMDFR